MKNLKNFGLSLIAVFLVTGCIKTRSELADIRSSQEVQAQQVAAQKEMQQQEMNEQIRSLVGRIEVLESQLSTLAEKVVAKDVVEQEGAQKKVDRMDALEKAVSQMDLKLLALSNEIQVYLKNNKAAKKEEKPQQKGNFSKGEESFSSKKWKEAIVNYEKYRELNPKGKKYATATYKIGVCFEELKMKDAAKSFYQEVVDKYSKSDMAKKAKYRLSKLK